MNGPALLASTNLLAAEGWDRIVHLRDGFRKESSDSNAFQILIVGFALCVAVVLVDQVYRLLVRRRAPRSADYLSEAVRLLALRHSEARDVRNVAFRCGWAEPAAMLLSPAVLAAATSAAEAEPALVARMDALSRKLFGEPLAAPGRNPGERRPSDPI